MYFVCCTGVILCHNSHLSIYDLGSLCQPGLEARIVAERLRVFLPLTCWQTRRHHWSWEEASPPPPSPPPLGQNTSGGKVPWSRSHRNMSTLLGQIEHNTTTQYIYEYLNINCHNVRWVHAARQDRARRLRRADMKQWCNYAVTK